jgi:steroid 5-alpha reductase family enzyme
MVSYLLWSILAILIFQSLFFIIAWNKKNNAFADIAWGGGFIVLMAVTWKLSGAFSIRQTLLGIAVCIWGIRLIIHIAIRNRGKKEDFRYREMRERWGKSAIWYSYTRVFLFQGLLMFIIGLPILLVNRSSGNSLTVADFLGAALWISGFLFETIADAQLRHFIKHRKKTSSNIMDRGLWKYSRHPNYFGESVMWWGIFLISFSVPYGWAGIVSPLLITFLLVKVSGIPPLEKHFQDNPAYQEYAGRTSVFVPWIPTRKR